MPIEYGRIVFLQGEEVDEALRILDEHGEEAALDYLAQWDMGDVGDIFSEPASGDSDDVFEDEHYRMSYNTRLGYIGLESIIEIEPEECDYCFGAGEIETELYEGLITCPICKGTRIKPEDGDDSED